MSQPALSEKLKPKRLSMAVVSIGVRRALNTALKRRKANAGEFLACIRAVNEIQLSEDDFGEQYHTFSSEPYFYDESYAQTKHKTATPIDDNGRCVVGEEVGERSEATRRPTQWKCTSECKLPSTEERKTVAALKSQFNESQHPSTETGAR